MFKKIEKHKSSEMFLEKFYLTLKEKSRKSLIIYVFIIFIFVFFLSMRINLKNTIGLDSYYFSQNRDNYTNFCYQNIHNWQDKADFFKNKTIDLKNKTIVPQQLINHKSKKIVSKSKIAILKNKNVVSKNINFFKSKPLKYKNYKNYSRMKINRAKNRSLKDKNNERKLNGNFLVPQMKLSNASYLRNIDFSRYTDEVM